MHIKHVIASLRPEQWVKNLFVFIPAFFAGRMADPSGWAALLLAWLAFSLMSSSVYLLNDYKDIEQDRMHPRKRLRPLASGAIRKSEAVVIGLCCWILAVVLAAWLQLLLLWILLAYFFINLLYTFWLKHIAIIDISIISVGFLLRIFAGGAVAEVPISHWLIVLTFLLAMILALGKRRSEFLLPQQGHASRPALDGYNLQFIDVSMVLMAAVTMVAYLMYTISEEVVMRIGSNKIYFTAFFALLGILRFLQLAMVYDRSASPTEVLLKDRFIQLVLLCWLAAFGWLLYA